RVVHRRRQGRGGGGLAGAVLEPDAVVGQDVLRVGQHVHQVRDGRALVAGHVGHARLEQRLRHREDAFAAKHLAGAERQLLHFLDERAFRHHCLRGTGHLLPFRSIYTGIYEKSCIPPVWKYPYLRGGPAAATIAPMNKRETAEAVHFVDDYLPALLAQASQLISGEFHRIAKAKGFTVSEWRVLASLAGNEPMGIGRLAEVTVTKQPTVTRARDRREVREPCAGMS